MASIKVNRLDTPLDGADLFLDAEQRRTTGTWASGIPSDLLQKVRTAIRGSDAQDPSIKHTDTLLGEESDERELSWSGHTAVLTKGGVIVKKWNFEEEQEYIQWACLGQLEQTTVKNISAHTAANYTAVDDPPPMTFTNGRPVFGPFTRATFSQKPDHGTAHLEPAVFIFLRSIAKIFLNSGLDYTFSLPFVVRRAWPLSPHGVLVQRVLGDSELAESQAVGDIPLPTIFSITSPFSEAAVVGLTAAILGETRELPASLNDVDEPSRRPLKSIPPMELVVFASRQCACSDSRVVVTVDVEKATLSIWQYLHVKPKETPTPPEQILPDHRNVHKKRHSTTSTSTNRRTSAMFEDIRHQRIRQQPMPMSPSVVASQEYPATQLLDFPEPTEMPPLSALPGMQPELIPTTTMASIASGSMNSYMPLSGLPLRPSSFMRAEYNPAADRTSIGRAEPDPLIDDGKMQAALWMECLETISIPVDDARDCRNIQVSLFDDRWDGKQRRSLMAISLPKSKKILVYSLSQQEDRRKAAKHISDIPGLSGISVRATRATIWDLLVLKLDHSLSLYTHGLMELPIELIGSELPSHSTWMQSRPPLKRLRNVRRGTVIATSSRVFSSRITLDIFPQDQLTIQCLQVLALTLPADMAFSIHSSFLQRWSSRGWSTAADVEFECFSAALLEHLQLNGPVREESADPFIKLAFSPSHRRLREDPALRNLRKPPSTAPTKPFAIPNPPHPLLAPVLFGFHVLCESLRLLVHRHRDVLRFAPLLCQLALGIRPEWADYWLRLVPDAMAEWPTPENLQWGSFEDKMSLWPMDIGSILHSRLSNPDWKTPWQDMQHIVTRFDVTPSVFYGICDPLQELHELSLLYNTLADGKVQETQQRAENAVYKMVSQGTSDALYLLPLGVATPLREAIRSCQLAPPANWPLEAYVAIGRNDLAASASQNQEIICSDGYSSRKEFMDPSKGRSTVFQVISEGRKHASSEMESITGVELNQKEFTDIRFGQDRRLEEVGRMLCSSAIPSVKSAERPDLSEADQTKEYQNQVVRIAERTFALPYGRAMFTFGSVPVVTREAYIVPRVEYSVRLQPLNILVTPDAGKLSAESIAWGDFHNGVAAALRIATGAPGVESSWIAFNKPVDLSPEHAGFLLGLGLTGHLKQMLTWHTFSYLTPKHDLTSIGLLLGLAAANVGSANTHVTKLLAVHCPALLPGSNVDLNVSLLTQAAGLSGIGLLYLGTKHRRMAEVCLSQVSRRDLVQPDLSNEHREAYTYCAAFAYGMIMLGKGSDVPADLILVKRLHILIHGAPKNMMDRRSKALFDINLTSPAASIALGLMYLRTGRRDIADILTIPDTILELNSIQPTFLLIRTIARALILFDQIQPSSEWIQKQVPDGIHKALAARAKEGKQMDDSMELAYYHILAGCCFALGLKYAGTARQEAYQTIVKNYDIFSRLAYSTGPAFDHKIKRSAVRDGLNLISLSLSMVMAGTGEISCLRRLRYSYGMYQHMMYQHGFKYGVHAATHMSLGLLFLGGGRHTLGTSDAAIASMVISFFPRFNNMSSDNKSFMQALRHLWVLAVEPRCLIARDVDTKEVVYLPVKITTQEGPEAHTTQLISPTLIPDLDRLLSIRVDTPRYWPFYLDTAAHPRHKESLLKSQTLYVKRRTAFLSYTEDPRGSRSLFVRSGSASSSDGTLLDFPEVPNSSAGDISEFINSFSNNPIFLAFADYLASPGNGAAPEGDDESTLKKHERTFHSYCHAALIDSIMQDKPETLQAHLTLYLYRNMDPRSRYFHLRMQDLRLAAEFYGGKVYEKRFSGLTENNMRPGLLREGTVMGALDALDARFEAVREKEPRLTNWVRGYARGMSLPELSSGTPPALATDLERINAEADKDLMRRHLAWYLLRNGVPSSALLAVLRGLSKDAHDQCFGQPAPAGTADAQILDTGIREVLHSTGNKMTRTGQHGTSWTIRSLDEIIEAWKD